MKKAYVKPVFMADEYELTASIANCGPVSTTRGWALVLGNQVCSEKHGNEQQAHIFENTDLIVENSYSQGLSYWDYATYSGKDANGNNTYNDQVYLFVDGNNVCDFIWKDVTNLSGQSEVYVWDSIDKTGGTRTEAAGSFVKLFTGSGSGHNIGTVDHDVSITPLS